MKFCNPSIKKTDYIKLWCIQILIIQICSIGEMMNINSIVSIYANKLETEKQNVNIMITYLNLYTKMI